MMFVLVNESTTSLLDNATLLLWAEVFAVQLAHDYASMWQTQPVAVQIDKSVLSDDIPKDACIVHFVDHVPEAPGALAYHTRDATGRPVAKIGVQTILDGGGSLVDVSEAASHEILEAWEDPYVSQWCDYDGIKKVADEVCDPVQGSPYTINGVQVANFVGPRWHDPNAVEGPFDFQNRLTSPLTYLPGGYLAFDDGSQVFGSDVTERQKRQASFYGRRGNFTKLNYIKTLRP